MLLKFRYFCNDTMLYDITNKCEGANEQWRPSAKRACKLLHDLELMKGQIETLETENCTLQTENCTLRRKLKKRKLALKAARKQIKVNIDKPPPPPRKSKSMKVASDAEDELPSLVESVDGRTPLKPLTLHELQGLFDVDELFELLGEDAVCSPPFRASSSSSSPPPPPPPPPMFA